MADIKSPLVIIAELIVGMINGIITTIKFVLTKFLELMITLVFYSTFGIYGFLIAVFIGAGVFILVTKFIFKSSKTLISLGIAFIAVIAVLAFFAML